MILDEVRIVRETLDVSRQLGGRHDTDKHRLRARAKPAPGDDGVGDFRNLQFRAIEVCLKQPTFDHYHRDNHMKITHNVGHRCVGWQTVSVRRRGGNYTLNRWIEELPFLFLDERLPAAESETR